MTTPTSNLYPTAPLEKHDLEQRLGEKLNDGNCFNNSIKNNKEMITYFKEKTTNQKINMKIVKP